MKNIKLIIPALSILFFLFSAQKCDKNSKAETVILPTELTLKANETQAFKVGEDVYTVTFVDIQDSRCPRGCQCIWEGVATTGLQFTKNTEQQKIVLHSTDKSPTGERHAREQAVLGLFAQMEQISPYPICHEDLPALNTYTVKISIDNKPRMIEQQFEDR